jgi:hypothetical protein
LTKSTPRKTFKTSQKFKFTVQPYYSINPLEGISSSGSESNNLSSSHSTVAALPQQENKNALINNPFDDSCLFNTVDSTSSSMVVDEEVENDAADQRSRTTSYSGSRSLFHDPVDHSISLQHEIILVEKFKDDIAERGTCEEESLIELGDKDREEEGGLIKRKKVSANSNSPPTAPPSSSTGTATKTRRASSIPVPSSITTRSKAKKKLGVQN